MNENHKRFGLRVFDKHDEAHEIGINGVVDDMSGVQRAILDFAGKAVIRIDEKADMRLFFDDFGGSEPVMCGLCICANKTSQAKKRDSVESFIKQNDFAIHVRAIDDSIFRHNRRRGS